MELLSRSVLSDDEKSAINRLSAKIRADEKPLARLHLRIVRYRDRGVATLAPAVWAYAPQRAPGSG